MDRYNTIKCVIIGDSNVGKTSIIHNYMKKKSLSTNTTLGAVFWSLSKTINGNKININLWDTAGQERYNSLIPMYTRGADIILFVFDLTDKYSFNNI